MAPVAERETLVLQEEAARGLLQRQGSAVEPGQIRCLGRMVDHAGEVVGHEVCEEGAVGIEVGEHLREPGLRMTPRRNGGFDSEQTDATANVPGLVGQEALLQRRASEMGQ